MKNSAEAFLVYLDTADWAYLQEGKARDAEEGLRQLGADGRVVFLISDEHLVEIAGLADGREERLAFIRSFPGTVRFPYSTNEVLQHEAWRLVELAEGRDSPSASVRVRPLLDVPWNALLAELDSLVIARHSYYWSAEIIAEGRLVGGQATAADVRTTDKVLRAFGAGDPTEITRQIIRTGQVPPQESGVVEQRIGMAMEALQSGGLMGLMGWVAEQIRIAGHEVPEDLTQSFEQAKWFGQWDPALLSLDPVFQRAVLPYLPDELRLDRERLAGVARGWKKAEIRSFVRPLAAHAALIKAIYFDPQRTYEGSEIADRRHAAYSPMVTMFTCDKRNERPLRDTFSGFGSPTPIIVRTNQLANIARVLLSALKPPG